LLHIAYDDDENNTPLPEVEARLIHELQPTCTYPLMKMMRMLLNWSGI